MQNFPAMELTPKAAAQIFNQYKEESLQPYQKNIPYLLVEEDPGNWI